jgi:hypothetical protein
VERRWLLYADPVAVVKAQEYGKTYDCRTKGCTGEARSGNGRHAYCKDCQIRRGTRRADGSLIMERIPSSPGSRSSRDIFNGQHGPFETKAAELVAAAREVDSILGEIIACRNGSPSSRPGCPKHTGSGGRRSRG